MSRFFKALEQAERERALREQGPPGLPPAAPAPGATGGGRGAEPLAPAERPAATPLPPAGPAAPEGARPPDPARTAVAPASATAEMGPARSPAGPAVSGRAGADDGAAARGGEAATEAAPRLDPAGQAPEPPAAAEAPEGVDGHLVSLLQPTALEAEPYRALRHLVEQLHRTQDLTVVVVSSPGAGDGKTTTAINLAGALAQDPRARVLLVDADLRRPAIPERLALGSHAGPGLVDAILDPTLDLAAVTEPCAPFNLHVVPSGRRPGTPYELLTSPRLGELLEAARRAYDCVVLDSPPLVFFPDCRVMGAWVDGFLVVVAAHHTPRKLLEEALATVEPSKLLGLVFNADDRPLGGYYYRYAYSRDGGPPNGHRWLGRLLGPPPRRARRRIRR